MSRLGLVVRRSAGEAEGRRFDSPLRLTFLLKKIVIYGHCLVILPLHNERNIKMALIAAHLNSEIVLMVRV